MDTTIIVFKALLGAGFAVVAIVASIIVAAFVVRSVLTGVNILRCWWMKRSIHAVDRWLGRSGV